MNKAIIKFVGCTMFAATFIFCSCKDKSRTPDSNVIVLDLKSGDGIRKSINIISTSKTWTQERFESINTAINTLASAGAINRNINEDKKHLANLFTSSAYCLERKVDSIFQLSVYTDYAQMKEDLKFLQSYLPIYLDAGVNIDSTNTSLEKVADLFAEYDHRLELSRYTFAQKAVYLRAYNQNYTNTEKAIKDDSKGYWSKYFSNNKELVDALNDFPRRLSESRYNYYNKLEALIESKALKDNFSKQELENAEERFYYMAENYNQKAISKLETFRENYTPVIDDTTEQ